MATLNASAVTDTYIDGGHWINVSLFVVGGVVSALATDWLQNNVYDFEFRGADSVYALTAGAVVLVSPVPHRYAKPVSMGCSVAAAENVLSDFGVLEI